MKKAVIATLLSSAIAAPAFAASENNLADADKVFNMDNAQTMELAALSSEEMEETEGSILPYVLFGASMYGHFTVRTLGAYYAQRIGFMGVSYGVFDYWGR
ncbi:hypothetical protein [Halomonas llamarensis]|uniref:Uncharacterized protein n=1 Tax=Halomonas llamarensis TaxID=2945104 RepID=A0ABT0SSR9_9GAMM|nr:hypothetical protein [Halomonas llamarensis]MCL7930879.1 hypothetical protein [Halomonas llamarensis]